MRALLRAAIAGRPVTEMVYSGYCLAQVVERAVDPLHHRQDPAGVDVRQPARHQHGVALLGDEAAHQVLGQDLDVLLHRLDALVAGLPEPAAQALERPDVAEARLLLEDLVRLGDDLERPRRRTAPRRVFHSIMTWTGLAPVSFSSMRPVAPQRLLAVRHLVGQAVARLELQIGPAARDERRRAPPAWSETASARRGRRSSPPGRRDRPSAVGGRAVLGKLALVADQEQPAAAAARRCTATNEMPIASTPAMPKVRISPDCEISKRRERQQRRAVRQHAGRPHHAHGKAHGLGLGVALAQADADGRHHLHAVGRSPSP